MHQIASEMGHNLLRAARARRRSLGAKERVQRLQEELQPRLGNIEPTAAPNRETLWKRSLAGAVVEAVSLRVEDGITVPLLLLLPGGIPVRSVVVGVAQGGKDRFLTGRANELEALLRAGIAVCLPDVRGTGETASGQEDDSDSGAALREFDLSTNLLGSRLKDLRTVLAYLREHPVLSRKDVALWGESFAPPNPPSLYLNEVENEAGPQVQRSSDPLGAHLVLLAGLYEDNVSAIAARGGLASYLSVLEDAYTYTPMHVIVWGILKSGDIADVAGALAPRPVALTDLVGGRNILVTAAKVEENFKPSRQAYEEARAVDQLTVSSKPLDLAAWLIAKSK